MKNRFGNDRSNYRDFDPSREGRTGGRSIDDRSGWDRGREDEGSVDEDRSQSQSRELGFRDSQEEYGRANPREWRDREQRGPVQGSYGSTSLGQRGESRPGWYSRGHTGTYGSGGGGGYRGGYESGGYGGSSGTDYSGSGYGSYAGGQGGYGVSQGTGYGTGDARGQGSFGSSGDQGYRSRDFGSPGRDLRSPQGGGFAGRGPKGYTRTDDRIREDVCDRLSLDDDVDATEIEVQVKDGEVTLEGSVETRRMKHQAEDLAEAVTGVKDVHNHLRVLKGFLNEVKDQLTGNQEPSHYANTGTKTTGASANGRA